MTLDHALSQNRGCFRFIGWALLLGSVLFVGRFVFDLKLAVTGRIADGAITKVTKRTSYSSTSRRNGESNASYNGRSGASTSYDLTVRFTPEGGTNTEFVTTSTFGHELKEGDTVKVIYQASQPTQAEIYSAKQLWLPLCVGFVVSAFSLGGGLFLLWSLRARPSEFH